MSNIPYIRISSIEQHTDRQELALCKFKINKYFFEKVSGKDTERAELKK